ncbi:MAG: hypothetical protein WCT33_04405 [Patescibacteria group bacterium]|jgi:hypothetical protein
MSNPFPDFVPGIGDVLLLTYPCGMVTEVVVRQRTIKPDGQIQINLWMSHHDSGPNDYSRVLTFTEGKWYATRLGDQTTHEVQLVNLMDLED